MSTQQLAHSIGRRHQVNMLDRVINDEQPTIALYTDPNDEIFHTQFLHL